jgi:hypothetical protein
MDESLAVEKGKNGRDIFTEKLADEIVAACGSGFTLEKAGALVGVNPSTIRTWAQRKPDFARRVETSRKKHELSLLRDIELAGAKSWQAKAWMAERIYNHAQPSARLQVTQDHTHGISSNLASLLAGIAVKKKEKKAEVIDMKESSYNIPCATNGSGYVTTTSTSNQIADAIITMHKQTFPKLKHKRMRLRKPRQSKAVILPTTTPPATPPAPA